MDEKQDQQNLEAQERNEFIRAAKKKSSLKTAKSSYKNIHSISKLGTVKVKTLKWNDNEMEKLQLEKRPNSNRKKLDESKTYYKAYVTLNYTE